MENNSLNVQNNDTEAIIFRMSGFRSLGRHIVSLLTLK